ncbi:hypothetical protein FK268_12815 [Tsukamurella sputi]|uniref:Uncharacterized protein n=1 Tax=Tsukamurella sputi TaxID=2591848 RepID=A0A5C5RM80_9ACTN|nr:hypothetical protein [Tsukamurella sputi]TWS23195.1 hypothetical protein FK268_12815 [Tsukamurella sputi]
MNGIPAAPPYLVVASLVDEMEARVAALWREYCRAAQNVQIDRCEQIDRELRAAIAALPHRRTAA